MNFIKYIFHIKVSRRRFIIIIGILLTLIIGGSIIKNNILTNNCIKNGTVLIKTIFSLKEKHGKFPARGDTFYKPMYSSGWFYDNEGEGFSISCTPGYFLFSRKSVLFFRYNPPNICGWFIEGVSSTRCIKNEDPKLFRTKPDVQPSCPKINGQKIDRF